MGKQVEGKFYDKRKQETTNSKNQAFSFSFLALLALIAIRFVMKLVNG